ncbi:unnamed protein product [Chrysodeixis includens]|uniref:Uncharacterized protein n=1 Tax=Chrysodeixis includens TaxID=689277 RepID=A0A9N8KTL6_CHRIL|nr:unnamed protein product [Chrysodeixis includens]
MLPGGRLTVTRRPGWRCCSPRSTSFDAFSDCARALTAPRPSTYQLVNCYLAVTAPLTTQHILDAFRERASTDRAPRLFIYQLVNCYPASRLALPLTIAAHLRRFPTSRAKALTAPRPFIHTNPLTATRRSGWRCCHHAAHPRRLLRHRARALTAPPTVYIPTS